MYIPRTVTTDTTTTTTTTTTVLLLVQQQLKIRDMATIDGLGRIGLAAFDSPTPKTRYRRNYIADILYRS